MQALSFMSVSHWPPKSRGTKHLRKQHLGFIIQDKISWRGITRLLGEGMVKYMATDSVSHFLQASCLILKGLAKQRWAKCVWLSQVCFLLLWPSTYVSASLRCWVYGNSVQQQVSLSWVTLERDLEQKKSPRTYIIETVSGHPACTLHVPLGPAVIFGLDL